MTSPPHETDEALATEARSGSRAAFEELVSRHGGAVVALLERRCRDHHLALDLAQEAWVRVFRALPYFDASRSFRPWLFSIALNAARDEGRRRKRSRIVSLDDYRESLPAKSSLDELDERALIDDSIAHVDEPFRTAILLVDVHGLSYDEAADSLGVAVGTIKSRVNRGRLAFRDHWLRLSGASTEELTLGGHS